MSSCSFSLSRGWLWSIPALLLTASSLLGSPPIRSTYFEGTAATEIRYPGANYVGTGNMTIEAWVYRENANRCETILSQNFANSFWFGFCNGSLRFYRGGASGSVDANVNVPARRWTHVAVTYTRDEFFDEGTVQFFIDGVMVRSISLAPPLSASTLPLYVGADPGGYRFHGALDEVRLWSINRSPQQIEENRFKEITSVPGLVAAFANGGLRNEVNGATPVHAAGVRPQIVGILPRDLVIPRTAIDIPVSGSVPVHLLPLAEQQVVRYWNGQREVDTIAYLMQEQTDFGFKIYAGFPEWEDAGLSHNQLFFTWSFDASPAAAVDSSHRRTRFNFPDGLFSFQQGNPPFGSWAGTIQGDIEAAAAFCRGEFQPPCVEIMTPFHSFTNWDDTVGGRILIHTRGFENPQQVQGIFRPVPFDANEFIPDTWPRFTLSNSYAQEGFVFVTIQVRVEENFFDQDEPLPVNLVTLTATSMTTGDRLRTLSSASHSGGFISFGFAMPEGDRPLIQLDAPTSWQIVDLYPGDTGDQPVAYVPNGAVYSDSYVDDGPGFGLRKRLADLTFRVRRVPAIAQNVTGFTPNEGNLGVAVRTDPLKIVPGDYLYLMGSNLHARSRIFLTTCDILPLPTHTDPWEVPTCSASRFHLLPEPEVRSNRQQLRIQLESETLVQGIYRILVRNDSGVGPRWNLIDGNYAVVPPPYPKLHGFEFANERDGTQFDAFSSIFQHNAYDCILFFPPGAVIPPVEDCPGCRILNPIYQMYYQFLFTPWSELMTGSCFGFSVTSLLFARGILDPSQFQPGANFAYGLLGGPPEEPGWAPSAPKPAQYNFRLCDFSEPVNLWSYINMHQQSQISSEIMSEVLSQMKGNGFFDADSIGGDPVVTMNRIAVAPTSYVLSIQNSGDLMACHAVVPYRVEHEMGVDESGFGLEPKANHSVIYIYENNRPGQIRYIEINRTENTYRYRFGDREVEKDVWEPYWYEGTAMYLMPYTLFTRPKTMLGLGDLGDAVALLLMGEANPLYEDASGGQFGYDENGQFVETYLGAKAMAPFAQAFPDGRVPYTPNPSPVLFFPPEDNLPEAIHVHPRGGQYRFNALEGGRMVHFEVEGRQAGGPDLVRLVRDAASVTGVDIAMGGAMTGLRSTIGYMRGEDPGLVFEWSQQNFNQGGRVVFEVDPARDAATFRNLEGDDLAIRLRVTHAGPEKLITTHFGPFISILGSAQTLVVEEFGENLIAQVEIDFENNGQPDLIFMLDPDTGFAEEPPPVARMEAVGDNLLRVTFTLGANPYILEWSDSLAPGVKWQFPEERPLIENGEVSFDVPLGEEPIFLRLRRFDDN